MTKIRYAKGPVVYLYDRANLKTKRKQLLWGDWLRIGEDIDAKWSEISWGTETFAIRKADYQEERLLELIFLDVGQGDGCILTTPHTGAAEKILIIDAGEGTNMKRFLNYRFRDFKKSFTFHAAVVTHPDSDHYRGFQPIFSHKRISFDHVYHNGIMERTGPDLLGPVQGGYLTDLRATQQSVMNLYQNPAVRGGKWYPKLLWTALNSGRVQNVAMLSTEHGKKDGGKTWMPGFAPSDQANFTIEVLGPVVENDQNGEPRLRTFGATPTAAAMDEGKTKNGHSVLLRLTYRDFSILFGGDLNKPAEHFLMRHYGSGGQNPTTPAEVDAMIQAARTRFGVDLMKTCHHGASDVTDEFLEATSPAAYVLSSGDEESHVHPRPDLLGLLGRKGRGPRPLILATEVLRSTREREDLKLRSDLDKLNDRIDQETNAEARKELKKQRSEILDKLFKRNVGVYGAINVRTDGRRAVVAFRNEVPKGINKWFYYELEPGANGVFGVKLDDGH